MTSLKAAVTHAELAYLLSAIIILETKPNQNPKTNKLVTGRCKTCFFEEMITQEIP